MAGMSVITWLQGETRARKFRLASSAGSLADGGTLSCTCAHAAAQETTITRLPTIDRSIASC